MAHTNRRYLKDAVIAVQHQTAFGAAGSTTGAMKLRCSKTSVDPGYQYVDLRGTSGSYHPKDTHFKTAEMPKVSLEMPLTKKALTFFAEHAMHGQPTATQANSDLSIANDGGGALASALVLNGVRPHMNTADNWKIYVTVTDETPGAGQARVSLYMDSGRTQKVAEGSAANGASCTLAEQNDSGLSGTVTLGTVSATDSDIEITIARVRPQRAGAIARYFTVWRDSGLELERVIDCTVERLARKSQELGPVMLEVDLVGSTHEGALSTALTPSLTADDKDVYLHDSVAYTSDVDSDAVAESVFRCEVELRNDIQIDVHNAAVPSAIWKRGVEDIRITIEQRFADEAKAIVASGLGDSWTSERVVDTHDSKAATWLFDKAKPIEPKLPDTGEAEWERVVHTFSAREETAASPSEPFTLSIQGP